MMPTQEEEGVKSQGCQKSTFDESGLGLGLVLIRSSPWQVDRSYRGSRVL